MRGKEKAPERQRPVPNNVSASKIQTAPDFPGPFCVHGGYLRAAPQSGLRSTQRL